MGSTRPIPMKETTHAKATAQTARGWRNGEVVGASCIGRFSIGYGCLRVGDGRQAVECGKRGEERALVLGAEHGEALRDAPRPVGAVAVQALAPGVGEGHEDRPAVGRVGGALRPAVLL